jgi:hypothetical protein
MCSSEPLPDIQSADDGTDGSITAQYSLNREWILTATAQYERYFIPILGGP